MTEDTGFTLDPRAEAWIRKIDADPSRFAAPKDSAVFYTSGQDRQAAQHCRDYRCIKIEGVRKTRRPGRPPGDVGAHGTVGGVELEKADLFAKMDKRSADAVWDRASYHYASQAEGRVEVFTGPGIAEIGTFRRIERNALIRNRKVTEINGVKREELAQMLDKGEHDAINKAINDGDLGRAARMEKRAKTVEKTAAQKEMDKALERAAASRKGKSGPKK